MDVRQLRYFVSVIELKSFTRAAEVLHIAQPALGMQIRKLEDELHTQLLGRHSRGVEPTAAGNLLWERAVAILRQVEEAKQAIRDLSGEPRGVIRFGTTPAMHPRISIGLLQRSAIELPNVQIQVQEAVTATLVEWVRTERVDIALVYLAGNRPKEVLVEDSGARERSVRPVPDRQRQAADHSPRRGLPAHAGDARPPPSSS